VRLQAGELESVGPLMTNDEIIKGYVMHVDLAADRRQSSEEDYFWAWEAVTELVASDPERAWIVLLAAIRLCAQNNESMIGAGPLEELLVMHPRLFASRVAEQLSSSSRFRAAFEMVRFSTEYASVEDANYFNATLLAAGVPASLVREWRIAEPEDAAG
jgi:hypothetical protein